MLSFFIVLKSVVIALKKQLQINKYNNVKHLSIVFVLYKIILASLYIP